MTLELHQWAIEKRLCRLLAHNELFEKEVETDAMFKTCRAVFCRVRASLAFLVLSLLCGHSWAATPMVAVGSINSCALLSSGVVQCWGHNGLGQLGNGGSADSSTPVTVTGINTAISVAVGEQQACAVLGNGSVKCWGYGESGVLGNGTSTNLTLVERIPVTVAGISTAIAVTAGWGNRTCALLSGGTVQCWGGSWLGNDGGLWSNTPVTVSTISTAVSVTAGETHTCVLLEDGTVKCWGENVYGQLGNGNTTNSNVPVTVSGISNASSVSAGSRHTCAVLKSGALQCWGYNFYGQLGNGTTNAAIVPTASPVTVTGISTAMSVTAGYGHNCAVLTGGTVQCWGYNFYGVLGNGTSTNSSAPVTVTDIRAVIFVAASRGHNCAVVASGSVLCWGSNSYGQLGRPMSTPLPAAVVDTSGQGFLNLGVSPVLSLSADADRVFSWAEQTYSQFFAPAGSASQEITGYRYRAYSGGHFLAVNDSGTAHLYYLGPFSANTVLDLGLLADWVLQAGPYVKPHL